jgi:transposase, IS30 family
MAYKQLNQNERYRISAMLESHSKIGHIATALQRSEKTIRDEIGRGKVSLFHPYCAVTAHQLAMSRKSNNALKMNDDLLKSITEKLDVQWSPEQIAGRLKVENKQHCGRQTIYNYIARNKRAGGQLYKKLRHGKPYRKRHTKTGRYKIPNRVDIDQRPDIVDKRSRVGDWEVDLVIGANHKGMIITANERRTGLSLQKFIPSKHADIVAIGIIQLLSPVKEFVHTITMDNGLEFAKHEFVSAALKSAAYFAKPYCSWQRGSNENTNRLIRQYFPKGSGFEKIDEHQILNSTNKLNHRPRKRLGYKTPAELFAEETKMNYNDVLYLNSLH